MNVLIVLVPVSLILAVIGLLTFLWTLKSEQYDDLEGDAWRILVEDDIKPGPDAPKAARSDEA